MNPRMPQDSMTPTARIVGRSNRPMVKKTAVTTSRMSTPPMVGVPCLTRCPCGPSARTCCPMLRNRTRRIQNGNSAPATTIATMTARNTWYVGYLLMSRPKRLGMRLDDPFHDALQLHDARGLHQDDVAGREEVVQHLSRLLHVRAGPNGLGGHALGPRPLRDALGARPHCHEDVRGPGHQLPQSEVRELGERAQLRHVAQHRDPPTFGRL